MFNFLKKLLKTKNITLRCFYCRKFMSRKEEHAGFAENNKVHVACHNKRFSRYLRDRIII